MLLLISSLFIAFSFADEFVEDGTTTIGGYGEMHYDMEGNSGDGKLDFHRFIFYIKHQFNSQWSMMSEIEIEHNMVYSEGDGGYLAMEQAHLNYFNGTWGWKGGVLLQPAGIINEYHEPPTFMSVERPEYNKYIIPTTWFGNGFAFYGSMGDFNWNVTMTGDLDGNAIDKGLRSARLKGVGETTEGGWLTTLQGSYTGIDGLKLGGSMTMNSPMADKVDAKENCSVVGDDANGDGLADITFNQDCVTSIDERSVDVSLTEFNATWSKNNLYARMEYGMIDYSNNFHLDDNFTDTPSLVWTPEITAADGTVTAASCSDSDITTEEDCSGYAYDVNGDGDIDEDDAEWNNVAPGTAARETESSSGYYLDLGYNVASLIGMDGDLFVWTRTSSYNRDDNDDAKDISLFGLTYKPLNNLSFKIEMGESGDKN